ncbi:hypothetical protein DRQ09_07430, partial [candidate division KSB1 bacterium]
IQYINKTVKSISREIERLSFFSKTLSAMILPVKQKFKKIDLSQLVEQVVENFRKIGILKYYKIEEEYSENNCSIRGVNGLLELVFESILVNSHKLMQGTGTIKIITRRENKFMECEISNTGYRMPEESLNKLQEPSFIMEEESIDLGLYTIKNIINFHRGYLKVKNNGKNETTFIIGLPVLKN